MSKPFRPELMEEKIRAAAERLKDEETSASSLPPQN